MEAVPGTRLMCDSHWVLVPDSLKISLFDTWNPTVPHDEQSQPVQNLINLAVRQVAIIERKVSE